ncbi:hypothetical protein GCK32_005524 [Trichostrongylus colubriformis]|uniref:G-protein coupled receptors family 1 profile domain-containing protein n=1 Tax=Trichostrongylus colubriformis TaxID=6319 RepID=A0AAN8FB18_TRICO
MVFWWSQWVFLAVNIVSLPVYLPIIAVCIKEYKHNAAQRSFYLIIVSQGFMDLGLMASYFIFATLRLSEFCNNFFWTYKDYYIASWCFNQTYVSAILRCFGVLVISFQRYVSLCKHGHPIEQIINSSHRWVLPLLQWTVPSIVSLPLLVISNATFIAPDNLEVLLDRQTITLATSMTGLFVAITFVLCFLCYWIILRFLVKHRYSNSIALKRERRLYVQMLGLIVGFALLFVFYVLQFKFSLRSNDGPVFTMRVVFPVVSCFFSYVNAWMMFILNNDIRRKVFVLMGFQVQKVPGSVNMSTSLKVTPVGEPTRF